MNDEKKKKIGVIGDSDFTVGFELAGIQKIYSKENYQEKIQELLESEELGILVVEESDLKELPKRLEEQVASSVDPVVVSLSESAESERLQEKIKKAIGADITG